MTLEQRIDTICEHLPDGWRIRIDLEKHSGTVTAIRPDGSEVDMGDGESDIEEQMRNAHRLAIDELQATDMDAKANKAVMPSQTKVD